MRAYVGGEGLWAKGQKEATYQLSQYIFTEEKAKYQSFLDSLKVPLGDSVALVELKKPAPVYDIAFQGFVDGGNHQKDIPTMIFLYNKFKNNKHISKAIEQLEIGDRLIQELLKVGEDAHYHITNSKMSEEQAVRTLSRINVLQKRLNDAEISFSYNMSEAAHWAANLLYINPTFTELFGYTFDEVPTVDRWWPLAYPDENYRKEVSDEWQKRVKQAIDTESEIEPMEVVVS